MQKWLWTNSDPFKLATNYKLINKKAINKPILILAFTFTSLLFFSCNRQQNLVYTFDSSKSIDSHEFPIKVLGDNIPENWQDFNYLVLEMKSSTAQRFLLGINTDNGLHEKRTHVFPKAWVRLSIPLEYFREKPRPGNGLAATVNKPLTVGFMHIEGGTVGPLTGVKGLSFKFYTPLNTPTIEIRSVKLTNENPGDAYLDTVRYVDEFGQWNIADFEGKVNSLEELKEQWKQEESSLKPYSTDLSKYGGYLTKKSKATGFFHVEKIDGKWWFIDPEGYYFLSLGAVGIERPGGGGGASDAKGLENVFKAFPPKTESNDSLSRARNISFGEWNLQRRYGETWREDWANMTLRRMDAWGLNTGSIKPASKPYFTYAYSDRSGVPLVSGLQDIFIPDYDKKVEEVVKTSVSERKNDPYLIGYFLQNEPSWLEQESRICGLILDGKDLPIKAALQSFLKEGDTPERRVEFVHATYRKHIATITKYLRKYDPNHLSVGIRFRHSKVPHQDILSICKDFFDVYSFNTYRLSPNMDYVNEVAQKIDLPMILGEFHFGTVDRGMAAGLVQVANQEERAVAFRYFAENAFANPSLIGVAWFQYTDQGILGRGDGERYNIGLVDVTDRSYPIVKGIIETAKDAYSVHLGEKEPYSQIPKGLRGNEDDLKSMSNQ